MVYVPDQKAVLMVGGYGPGWVKLNDTWIYETDKNAWTRLNIELPIVPQYATAAYLQDTKAVLLSTPARNNRKKKKTVLLGLRLDTASAPKAAALTTKAGSPYHCKGKRWAAPLPEEWYGAKNKASDPEAGRGELLALPANTWVWRKPPMKARARQWGKYIYDPRTHKGYAWGGGHYGYIGAEVGEYDLLTNRWSAMDDPVNYKLLWEHSQGGTFSPGVGFQGWALMGNHARKSYAVDPVSNSVLTEHGDVYDIAERRFVANIGRCPGRYLFGDQVAFVNTPQGVYGFHSKGGLGQLWLADVKAGKWKFVAKGGNKRHHEYCNMCYDSKRGRIVYVDSKTAAIWIFDLKAKAWSEEKPGGKAPKSMPGEATYVADLDAAMMVCTPQDRDRKSKPQLFFYKLGEKKWYSAPYAGERFGSYGSLNNSPVYDPKLKLVVRITHASREGFVEVLVMRLDVDTLRLTPLQ